MIPYKINQIVRKIIFDQQSNYLFSFDINIIKAYVGAISLMFFQRTRFLYSCNKIFIEGYLEKCYFAEIFAA